MHEFAADQENVAFGDGGREGGEHSLAAMLAATDDCDGKLLEFYAVATSDATRNYNGERVSE